MPRDQDLEFRKGANSAVFRAPDTYDELVRGQIAALAPTLNALPDHIRAIAVERIKQNALNRQDPAGRLARTVAGSAKALAGAAIGASKAMAPLGLGTTDPDTGLEVHPAISEANRQNSEAWGGRQAEYENADEAEKGSRTFLRNMQEGAASMWEGLTNLPGIIEQSERQGRSLEVGEAIGDAVVRDAAYLATSPRQAIHNDPVRALDLASPIKGAGSAIKAAKFLAKGKGMSKVAKGLGVAGEFLDPTPDTSRVAVAKMKGHSTPDAERFARVDPEDVAKATPEAIRSGSASLSRVDMPWMASGLELSRAEKAAAAAGKMARSGVLFGALASDAIGPIGAVAVGAAMPAAMKLAGPGVRKMAKVLAKEKHGVNLSDDEASMAVFRAVADPDAQVSPSAQMAVQEVTRDPIHGRQAIETTSAPLSEAIRQGKLKNLELDPNNPSSFDKEGIRYNYRQWNDGRIEANSEGASEARAAFTGAGLAERDARVSAIVSRGENRRLKDMVAPFDEQTSKDARAVRSKTRQKLFAEDEAKKYDTALEVLGEPSPAAKAAVEASEAYESLDLLKKDLTLKDRMDRQALAARGEEVGPSLSVRVNKLRAAEASLAADRSRIAKLEDKARRLGPESEELIGEARDSMRRAIFAKRHLDDLMGKADKVERQRMGSLLRRISAAEKKADRSAAFSRVADRDIRLAKEAALGWKDGDKVTGEVLVGLSLIRRDAIATSKKVADVSQSLHDLSRSRGKDGWTLREAVREVRARDTAKKLDEAFDKALADAVKVDELRAGVWPQRLLREADVLKESQSMLDVIPRRERELGVKLAEGKIAEGRSSRIANELSQDHDARAIRDVELEAEKVAAAARAERTGPDGKVRRLDKSEKSFVAVSAMKRDVDRLAAGLSAEIEALATNPAYEQAVKAGVASHRRSISKKKSAIATKEARTHLGADLPEGEPAMQRGGSRSFAKLDEGSLEDLADVAIGISSLVREMPDLDVSKVLARSINKTSMIHAMNKRIVGWVSDRFYDELKKSGVTDDAIRATESYKSQASRLEIRKSYLAKQFVRDQIEKTIVEHIQKSDLLAGSEPHILIDLPDGRVFDVGEHIYRAFDDLESKKGVSPNELLAESAQAAFGKMAVTYLERKTHMAIAHEVARSADLVSDAFGKLPPPVAQMSSFVKTHAEGSPGNIVLFSTDTGSPGLQEAIAGSFDSVAADAKAKYGIAISPENLEAAKLDLQNNFMEAPDSITSAMASGLADMGIETPGDIKVYVRFGYGQSVGTHLDYLRSLDQVGNMFVSVLRSVKRGVTVGSTGAVMMNALSNVVLLSVMTGRSDIIPELASEAARLRQYEVSGAKFGPGTREGKITAALLSTGIGDSSLAREFSGLRASLGSTKGGFHSLWDSYWGSRVGIYKQVDSLPKLLLSRIQMKALLDDVSELKAGDFMSLDQGGSSRSVLYKDDAGNLRLNGDIVGEDEVMRVAAKQATRSAAAVLFDFNETGLLLKAMTKNPMPSVFNELGAWFLKAIEMPGRQGIVSSSAFFDPRSAYVTNSTSLLAKKAKSFTTLAIRRHAMLSSARAVAEEGNRAASSFLGWGPGSTLLMSPNEDGSGRDINVADITSSNWMTPMLSQAAGVAMIAGSVADLFNQATGDAAELSEAEMAVMAASELGGRRFKDYRGLSEKDRNKAILVDRRIQRQHEILSGKRDFITSLLNSMQLTGGLFGGVAKANDTNWSSTLGTKMLSAFLGGDAVSLSTARQDKEDVSRANPDEWAEGDESYVRQALAGLFRFVGRSRNSQKEIAKRTRVEKSAIRARAKVWFKDMHPEDARLRRQFLESMVDDAAEMARQEIQEKTWGGM